jgi:hypothetical protein
MLGRSLLFDTIYFREAVTKRRKRLRPRRLLWPAHLDDGVSAWMVGSRSPLPTYVGITPPELEADAVLDLILPLLR